MKKEKEESKNRTIEVSKYMPFFEGCVPSFLELEDVKSIWHNEIMHVLFQGFVWYVFPCLSQNLTQCFLILILCSGRLR